MALSLWSLLLLLGYTVTAVYADDADKAPTPKPLPTHKPVLVPLSADQVSDISESLVLTNEATVLCDVKPSNADITDMPCTMEQPCYAALGGMVTADDCDTCYIVGYHQDESENDACLDGKCPELLRKAFVKIVEFHRMPVSKFGFFQQAWKALCPHACLTANVCAEDEKTCTFGVFPDKLMSFDDQPDVPVPGASFIGSREVVWQKVECATGEPAPGDANRGGADEKATKDIRTF